MVESHEARGIKWLTQAHGNNALDARSWFQGKEKAKPIFIFGAIVGARHPGKHFCMLSSDCIIGLEYEKQEKLVIVENSRVACSPKLANYGGLLRRH